MVIQFRKMHGAGNDFILIDDRLNQFPDDNTQLIQKLCRRRTGIGCEGLILIRKSEKSDFSMRFFNPDGKEASMCGNGARCIALLAFDLGVAESKMQFETKAGTVDAEILGKDVKLHLPPPSDLENDKTLTIPSGSEIPYDSINTGVPHAVVFTENLSSYPVLHIGQAVIKHEDFAPHETNVNFVEIGDNGDLNIRTYERGVEDETLACGTGITAAAIISALKGKVQPPVTVRSAGGDTLTVGFTIDNDSIDNVTLTGPAEYVFCGEFETKDSAELSNKNEVSHA